VRSGGQSHFHAPAAIKSWAARGLIMRARIYVNAAIYMKKKIATGHTRIIHFVLFSLSCGLRWQRIISQSDVLTFISIFQNAPTDIHAPRQSELVWRGQNLAPRAAASRKNVLSWRFEFFCGQKSMTGRDFNRVFPLCFFIIFHKVLNF